jgi:hypothetical protein
VNRILHSSMWDLQAALVGHGCRAGLSTADQGVHLWKEAIVFEGPLILLMPVLGSHIELDRLQDEETP